MVVSTGKYLLVVAGALAVAGCAESPGGGPAADAMPAAAPEAEAAPVPSEAAEVAEPAGMEAVPEVAAVEVAEAGPPVTEAPREFAVGSAWTGNFTVSDHAVRATLTLTLVEKREFRGREVDVLASSAPIEIPESVCNGMDAMLVDVATAGWVGCIRNGEIVARYDPHDYRFSWPLHVGKRWERPNKWVDNVANTQGSFTIEWEVAAWEEVTVPAGTFMAYRIERADWPQTVWYAPELMEIVKSTSGGGDSGQSVDTWELVSSDPK